MSGSSLVRCSWMDAINISEAVIVCLVSHAMLDVLFPKDQYSISPATYIGWAC